MIRLFIFLSLVLFVKGFNQLNSFKKNSLCPQKITKLSFKNVITSFSASRLQMSIEDEFDNENLNTELTKYEELSKLLKGTSIYLVGMMGTGKSSVGDVLARNLGYRFIDTDDAAEFMLEMPIAEFFNTHKNSEPEFRELEYQILMEMAQYTRVVVATGGGIVLEQKNWGVLHHGLVVFLDMAAPDIYERLSKDSEQVAKRPLLQGDDPLKKLNDIATEREEKYKQADIIVSINLGDSIEDVMDKIVDSSTSFIKSNPPQWEKWKKDKDNVVIERAMRVNPGATANITGAKPTGSITEVSIEDIKSGKVKLPQGIPKSQD